MPEVVHRYVKQTGGKGHFAHVVMKLERGEPASGIVFESRIKGGVIPREYVLGVEKGVREAAESGVLAGYPVTDVKVTLYDGSIHEVDSSEMSFKVAGSMAFKEGVQRGAPVLLEPVMHAMQRFLNRLQLYWVRRLPFVPPLPRMQQIQSSLL